MSLAPYPRRVARVQMPTVLRWDDMPAGTTRIVTLDVSAWAGQVPGDPATTVTAAVTPSASGLAASGAAVADDVITVTLAATSPGIGTDFLVLLTATTADGRVEPHAVRVLVTDPAA